MVLQSIRERLTGIVAIFIFGILIIPFAFVGVGSYFSSDAVNAVALVNGEEITTNDFNQSFQNYRRRMQSQMGANFDPEQFDQLIVRREHLDTMIDRELLVQLSDEAGLAVDDQLLAQTIRNELAFQVDGEFNAQVYESRLASAGITPRQYEDDVRSRLVLGQFPNAIATSGVATPWEINDYVRLLQQARTFEAIVVAATVPTGDEASDVSEEEVLAWYEENQGQYLSEEKVVIEYLELDAAQIGGEVEVTEDELRARFEEQESRFINPEGRLASHILIEVAADAPQADDDTARQKAEDARDRALAGEDFAELAREVSEDIGSSELGGDLGWIEPGFMVQAFEDALYELTPENPVSEPVKTGFGWHIIQLREVRPAEGMTFAEAREVLLEEYQAEEDERRFIEQADRLIDIIYEDPTTLDAAADELGLEIVTTEPFGRMGNPDGGVTSNPEVVKAAFSDLVLGQGSVSDPIDLGTNHIVLVLLKEHMPQALLPLEEVRDQVVSAIRQERAIEAANVQAQQLLVQAQSGATLQEIADANELELVSVEAAPRRGAGVDQALANQVFLMDRPAEEGSVMQVVELPNGYALVQLIAVEDGELGPDDELAKRSYSRMVANGTASEETLGFMRMLRAQSEIEIFEDRL